jgi:GAF domain-containing protein
MGAEQQRRVLDAETNADVDQTRQAAVRHVCIACGIRTDAVGTAIYLRGPQGVVHPYVTAGFCGEEVGELQTVLAEGPAFLSMRQSWPVLVPDLTTPRSTERWPLFAPAAADIGVAAVFAFPLTLAARSLGTLEVHRDSCGALLPDEIADVVRLADAATALLLDQPARFAGGNPAEERDDATPARSGPAGRRSFPVASDGAMFTNGDK